MKRRSVLELFTLAAIWGASFLFMRIAAPEFGPSALALVRTVGGSLFLLPLLLARGETRALRRHWKPIFIVGLLNSGLPFVLYSYAALYVTAGLSSIFNATTPLWGALIAWLWLRDELKPSRALGLAVGFAGVVWLAYGKASFRPGAGGVATGWAVLACLGATLLYGIGANFTKRFLRDVPALALATGSQLSSAIVLVIPAVMWAPPTLPTTIAWSAAAALAVLCTGVAYILYFRLIAEVGPANAMTVTFLIPAFAVLWGWLFLAEALTLDMLLSCAVILLGTGLTTGFIGLPLRSSRWSVSQTETRSSSESH